MNKRKTFAERLREEREKKGLTVYALAKASGMSKQALGKLEAGQREPAWVTVQVIARALGVSCECFVDDMIEMPSKEEATTGKRGRPRKTPPSEIAGKAEASDQAAAQTTGQGSAEPPASDPPVKAKKKATKKGGAK